MSTLKKNQPKAKVKLSFYSYQNQLLAEATTDKEGLARVTCDEEVHLITATTEDDFSFIRNSSHELDQSKFKFGGRWLQRAPYEAALYATRAFSSSGRRD